MKAVTNWRRGGTALVEFALMSPLLLLLLAGVVDYGMALRTATEVAAAARAGAQYGSRSVVKAADVSGIRAAALNAAPSIRNLTISAVRSCQCPGGGSVSCSGTCPGGRIVVYTQVTAQANASNIFRYSGLSFAGTTSTQIRMRAQ